MNIYNKLTPNDSAGSLLAVSVSYLQMPQVDSQYMYPDTLFPKNESIFTPQPPYLAASLQKIIIHKSKHIIVNKKVKEIKF
ncbi:hypothetical protein [Methanobacterium sp.]|uniref:hypothetical protein n=1 Tax=Methanobacterium sp. TaxID=2164 RepID=UPI002ABA3CFF|nr:hypothetical protein [Methanobacterium sp.]MDY9924335.1 hypothetical protein [Methanobacterium sp.]